MSTFRKEVRSSKLLSELLDFSGITGEEFGRKIHPYIFSTHIQYNVAKFVQLGQSCVEVISKHHKPLSLSVIERIFGNTVSKFAYIQGTLDEKNALSKALSYANFLRKHAVLLKTSGDPDWKFHALSLGFIEFKTHFHLFSKESIPILVSIFVNEWKSLF
ncbi:hypothetical protein TNCT_555271 [Trichonephila clavata]|uniref:Uncharacterized protein n=1 Tax=Trichonephila clavata TaxID=2740835 RepID=A0A8X6LKT1_TRICU|nr:hypothetical protein TNCT_555271 [Trichonephila clavata]